jgi:hypothetical protein
MRLESSSAFALSLSNAFDYMANPICCGRSLQTGNVCRCRALRWAGSWAVAESLLKESAYPWHNIPIGSWIGGQGND